MHHRYWMTFLFLSTAAIKRYSMDYQCNGNPRIVSRSEWRAREPRFQTSMVLPVSHIIIIHTVTPTCDTKQKCIRQLWGMQDYHMDYRGFDDIGYSFLVSSDGIVYTGRSWNYTTRQSINFNRNSIAIAFIGNFMHQVPTKESLKAAKQLITCGMNLGHLTPNAEVHGHRDVACTLSPGDTLYKIIRTWKNYIGGRIPNYYCIRYNDSLLWQ